MWPCGLNLAILYLPLPSGFLLSLSVFAKWLHTYMCLQSPVQQYCKPSREGRRGHSDILFTYFNTSPSAVLFLKARCRSIPAAFPLKSPPRWERLIIFPFPFFLHEQREWKSRPISLLTWTREKQQVLEQQNSLQLQEQDLWFGISKGSAIPGCRGSQGRNTQTYFAWIWLAGCSVLLHICLNEKGAPLE